MVLKKFGQSQMAQVFIWTKIKMKNQQICLDFPFIITINIATHYEHVFFKY